MELNDTEIVAYFTEYSKATGLSLDLLLSIYLLIGKDIFCLFSLLQGKTVKFPHLKNYKNLMTASKELKILELKAHTYKVNGKWKDVEELEVGDILEVGNTELVVVLPVQKILNHYYLLQIR